MMTDGIMPGLVSLLGRAGLSEEELDSLMKSSFAKKCPELWRILLSSCVALKFLFMLLNRH
jgi:hypothetical protein